MYMLLTVFTSPFRMAVAIPYKVRYTLNDNDYHLYVSHVRFNNRTTLQEKMSHPLMRTRSNHPISFITYIGKIAPRRPFISTGCFKERTQLYNDIHKGEWT